MVVSRGIYNIAPVRVVTQATLLRCPSRTHDDRMNWQVQVQVQLQLSRAPAARLDPFSCVTAVSLTVVPSLFIIRTLIIRTPSSLVT